MIQKWRNKMLNLQNRSQAVMARRQEPLNSLDDFPTPPWATRALMEKVLHKHVVKEMSCREPACGRGYMSKVLKEYFKEVLSSDVAEYGYGLEQDFLANHTCKKTDWLITNPPFKLAEEFVAKGLNSTTQGLAVLVRTMFLEGVGRHNRLFSKNPPSYVAQFSERVPIIKGRIDPKASSATGYAWIVWDKSKCDETKVIWIPPCRKTLEKNSDYSH